MRDAGAATVFFDRITGFQAGWMIGEKAGFDA
jgi:hypothetical protein